MAYPTWKPPSLKFSQTHARVGHTLKKLWPRGSTHTGHSHPFTMVWLVLHEGDLERRRFPAPFGGASSTFSFSFFRLCWFPWTCHLHDVGLSETSTSQRQQWG